MTHTNQSTRGRSSLWSLLVWGGAGALLLTPLIAMQFTREVAWTGFDFAVFGTMLFVACGLFELAVRLSGNASYRAGVAVAVAAAFVLVWINIAVGMIGDEGNPANLIFAGVLCVGIIGAVVARFRAAGMARAMAAMALAQVVASVAALLLDGYGVFGLTAAFAVPWLLAAWLFSRAAASAA